MNIQSAKAKGRRLAQDLKDALIDALSEHLVQHDILVTSSSVPGPDLYLSPRARELLNMQFECKNQERVSVWAAIEQCQTNCRAGETPVVVIARNRVKPQVLLPLTAFANILREAKRKAA